MTPERRIVDFTNVKYHDSTALGSLIRALKRLREREPDATVTLINVSKQIYPLFEITRLDEVLIP